MTPCDVSHYITKDFHDMSLWHLFDDLPGEIDSKVSTVRAAGERAGGS